MTYLAKTPWWLKVLFPAKLIWKMPEEETPTIYLTFDDGPHPVATPFVLQQLKRYGGTATFFCIGKNVEAFPELYQQTIEEGHTIGNHTHNHLNGWKTNKGDYIENIDKAAKCVDGRNFRPPYGRIRRSQAMQLWQQAIPWKIYMWDVLSADYDRKLTPEECLKNVIDNISPGSIVVFHDSEKAWDRMSYALPHVLEYCKQKQWRVAALPKY